MLVSDLKNITQMNVPVEGTYIISKCALYPFKQKEGYFLNCILTDKTGTIVGVIWNDAEKLKEWLRDKMAVAVKGKLSRHNDIQQIVIETITQTTIVNKEDFLPSLGTEKIEFLWRDLLERKSKIKDDMCKLIWKYVLNNYPEFKTCPGGVGQVHHNYIGGLLEHTCSMITLLRGRTDIDLSIALTGALLHDIGKIQAYQWDTVIEMSDSGRLLGHLNLGYEMLCEIVKSRSISRKHFNHVVLLKLKHIILSHHGINEIKPMFPEAVAVSAADGFDSGVNHSVNWIANPGSWGGMQKGNWTSFCNLTERFYYSPNEPVIPIAKENTFQPKKDDNSMF